MGKYKIEGTYQISGSDEKEFVLEYSNSAENEAKKNALLRLLDRPWLLLKEGGKHGVSSVKRFFTVLFLFSAANTFLFFYALYRLFSTEFEFSKLLVVFVVLLLGVLSTVFASYKTYQYVVIDTIRVIYENLTPLFQKISTLIVDKISNSFQGKVDMSNKQITNALNFGEMVNSNYKKMPKILRKGIVLILNRIPFVGMLMDVKTEIFAGNKQSASLKLYQKMDGFISGTIFGNNTTRWIWWLLPLNILVLAILIKLKIG